MPTTDGSRRPPRGGGDQRGRARTRWWPLPVLGLVAWAVLSTHAAVGGFSARVMNTADKLQTGSLITTGAAGSTTECDLSTASYNPITTANTASCTGTVATPGTLPSSGTSALATTVADKGSLAATATSLSAGACGPVQLANATSSTDPMLVRGTTFSYAQTGPLTGGLGIGLSGTSGYAADVTAVAGPTTTSFTEAIWFKTTTAGTLMGFTNTPSTASPGEWDKMLWVDNSGNVVWALYPGSAVELATSGTSYLDGKWHLAVGELNTSSGMSLSVDGATPITNTTESAQSYTGYWHVGWDNESSGWSDPPTNTYFTGTLADAAVFPSALSTAQVTALKGAGTQATWTTRVAADGASLSWTLGDTPGTPYTGTVPGVTAPCSFVDVTVGAAASGATTCALPSSASACAAPSSSATLTTLAGRSTPTATYPSPSGALTLTLTLARDGTNTTSATPNATGLHLTMPVSVVCSAGGFTATLSWATEDVIL